MTTEELQMKVSQVEVAITGKSTADQWPKHRVLSGKAILGVLMGDTSGSVIIAGRIPPEVMFSSLSQLLEACYGISPVVCREVCINILQEDKKDGAH